MDSAKTSVSVEELAQPRFQFLPSFPLQQTLPSRSVPIADMANLFGVTHRTLHFYEEKRLILADRMGAMRIYDVHQVRIMALISLCRECGMAIAQIQDLFAELDDIGSQVEADAILTQAMKKQKRELLSTESLIRRQMQQVNELLDHAGDAGDDSEHRRPDLSFLSEFELECLGLMSEGYTPLRISNLTGQSVDEILATEADITRKFGSTNRFQAVAKAVLLGLIGN